MDLTSNVAGYRNLNAVLGPCFLCLHDSIPALGLHQGKEVIWQLLHPFTQKPTLDPITDQPDLSLVPPPVQ